LIILGPKNSAAKTGMPKYAVLKLVVSQEALGKTENPESNTSKARMKILRYVR
jgi:hypothetical protein